MMKIKEAHPKLTDMELAIKLLDELICLKFLRNGDHDLIYGCVKDALEMIASARRNNPNFPITVLLADKMRERGLM